MPAKKKVTTDLIISAYMDYVLEHNQKPKSVFAFAKENNFDEAKFYDFFGSFEAVEQAIFKAFFDNTLKLLHQSEEFSGYDAKNKLLSFYFTFFENLTANRSYVVYALNKHRIKIEVLKSLTLLQNEFGKFIDDLGIETINMNEENLNKAQALTIRNSAWLQLLVTIKFWLKDSSASFQKTDIFIEKSLNATFELMNIKPLQSIVDLGKFMFKEKMNIKT
jgi:hypothetical protein